jgi:hypothetical protein
MHTKIPYERQSGRKRERQKTQYALNGRSTTERIAEEIKEKAREEVETEASVCVACKVEGVPKIKQRRTQQRSALAIAAREDKIGEIGRGR